MSGKKRKQGEDKPNPYQGDFSFVNKDASNIDSKSSRAAVSWHILNRYEKWKKQGHTRRERASARPARAHASATTAAGNQPMVPVAQQNPSLFMEDSLRPRDFSSFLIPYAGPSTEQVSFPGPSSGSSETTPSMTSTSFPGQQLVPGETEFSSYTALMNLPYDPSQPQHHPLFSSFVSFAYEYIIPQAFPDEAGRPKGIYEISKAFEDIPNVDSDPCFTNASLALIATIMASFLEDENITTQARSFMEQALFVLRQRVVQQGAGSNLETLKAILKMFSAETAVDNTAYARAHLKMLRNLVIANGNMSLLDSWFRENLLSCDCYFALKYETRPLFPVSEWSPGSLAGPWMTRMIGAGFFKEPPGKMHVSLEHPSLKSIVVDLRELFEIEEYIYLHDMSENDQLRRWAQLRLFHCINRIANHRLSATLYAHLFEKPKAQVYTCEALALMTALVYGTPEPVRFGLKMIENLRLRIEEAEGESLQEANDKGNRLKLWALYVGSLGEKTHPVPVNKIWFSTQFEELSQRMQLKSWNAVKAILKRFLYSDNLHQEITSGRPFRTVEIRNGLYEVCTTSWREPLSILQGPEFSVPNSTMSIRAQGKQPEISDTHIAGPPFRSGVFN